jgi:dTDP-glucose pyrophosphorylase
VKDILIISIAEKPPKFKALFGNGEKFVINLIFRGQSSPDVLV